MAISPTTTGNKIGSFSIDIGASDDSYNEYISQFKNSPFFNQLSNNPYLVGNNNEFVPNFWQNIGENWLDDFSARNQYYGNLVNQRNQYLSEILGQMRQQDYDSASSQVEREKIAGLNPDLNGGSSISPGASAENDQPQGQYMYPSDASSREVVAGFADLTMKAYSFASGFAKDMFTFKALQQSITEKDTENTSKMASLVRDFIRDTAKKPYYDDQNKHWVFDNGVDSDYLNSYARQMFRSRVDRKKFVSQYMHSVSSARSLLQGYTDKADLQGAITALNDSIGVNLSRGYDYTSSLSGQDPVIMVSKELSNMRLSVEKAQLSAAYTSSNFHKKVLDNTSAELQGKATDSQNQAVIDNNRALESKRKVDAIVNGTLHSIIDKLSKASEDTGIYGALAKGMLLYYSAFGLSLPSLPSINMDFGTKNFLKMPSQ